MRFPDLIVQKTPGNDQTGSFHDLVILQASYGRWQILHRCALQIS